MDNSVFSVNSLNNDNICVQVEDGCGVDKLWY